MELSNIWHMVRMFTWNNNELQKLYRLAVRNYTITHPPIPQQFKILLNWEILFQSWSYLQKWHRLAVKIFTITHPPIDESAYQILSYGLLFSLFYYSPSTADPPTCTMLMQPSMQLTWSPSTIPYTHRTIGPTPHCRSFIWPMDHIVLFSFLGFFSITWRILLQPSWSQAIALHGWDFTICFTAHESCAHFIYCLYLKLLYLLWKRRKFFPWIQT